MGRRRLVVCLDGTWNNPERARSAAGNARFKPTNVLKIYRAVRPLAADGTSQIASYQEGVGAFVGEPTRFGRLQQWSDRLFGGLFGGGFESRVKSAYRFLVGNYQRGDEIYLFGFSRGAAQARSLARFVSWTGGLLAKRDEYYIPELFDAFRRSRARPGAAATAFASIRGRRQDPDENAIGDPAPVEIAFLGVFDTVLSLGPRLRADRLEGEIGTVERKNSFHVGTTPPEIVRIARQALALDERRWDYRPQIWAGPGGPEQSLEQRWFPGAHSNVGGGYARDGLANFALYWMVAEARRAGLELDADYLAHFRPNPRGHRPDELAGIHLLGEVLRGKLGRGRREIESPDGARVGLDPSLLRVLLEDPSYRPEPLLAALRRAPEAARGLSGPDRERLDRALRRPD
ncbi:MAG: DUF2235 domain-containing protein [Acidobacteria bacterium]|nr:DUF2235 domain-containing protein [Acidobacteriota bacterium]